MNCRTYIVCGLLVTAAFALPVGVQSCASTKRPVRATVSVYGERFDNLMLSSGNGDETTTSTEDAATEVAALGFRLRQLVRRHWVAHLGIEIPAAQLLSECRREAARRGIDETSLCRLILGEQVTLQFLLDYREHKIDQEEVVDEWRRRALEAGIAVKSKGDRLSQEVAEMLDQAPVAWQDTASLRRQLACAKEQPPELYAFCNAARACLEWREILRRLRPEVKLWLWETRVSPDDARDQSRIPTSRQVLPSGFAYRHFWRAVYEFMLEEIDSGGVTIGDRATAERVRSYFRAKLE